MSATYTTDTMPYLDKLLEINEFFDGKSVFLTGGTGFMGKVLLEKLLWSCEGLENVYLLLRERRHKSVEQRLQEILDLPIFERIRKKDVRIFEKIIPIPGNANDLNLGMCNDDIGTLQNNVSVIFHFAASVKFIEPIRYSILTNVRGTREILDIAVNMKSLKAFVHVSSVYANTSKSVIEEKVYTDGDNWRCLIEMAETFDEISIAGLQQKITGSHPNIYAYTKHLAEILVHDYRNKVPVVILRPSIVFCSLEEPCPGWVDNMKGFSGMWFTVLTGISRVGYGIGSTINDYIPCDYCANALIAAACYRGYTDSKTSIVINAASGDLMKASIQDFVDVSFREIKAFPFEKIIMEPNHVVIPNRYIYKLLVFLLHIIPGMLYDMYFKISGIDFSLLKTYRNLFFASEYLHFFCSRQWSIETANYRALGANIHPKDKRSYPMDCGQLRVPEMMRVGILGIKKYMLKEEVTEEAVGRAKTRLHRLIVFHNTMKMIFVVMILYAVYKYSKITFI